MPTFEVTAQHLTLLRAAYVSWNDDEFGAPSIDPKRPYGNGDVYRDMAELLDYPNWEADDREYSPLERDELARLHKETATVLQIILATGEMRPGRYRAEPYQATTWRRAEEGTSAV